ncbi:MAG TPA: hypothetical protein V6D50_00005, partial [Chroococcales cyanobacterium]
TRLGRVHSITPRQNPPSLVIFSEGGCVIISLSINFYNSLAQPTKNTGKSQDSGLEAPTILLNDCGLGQN